MQFSNIFGIHEQALELRARRTEVLASNIANADTPGYQARDFDFTKVLLKEMGPTARLASTHPKHMRMSHDIVAPNHMQYRVPQQPSTDGNTVEMEREQVEYGANAMAYQATLRFLDGRIKSIKTAIKGQTQ